MDEIVAEKRVTLPTLNNKDDLQQKEQQFVGYGQKNVEDLHNDDVSSNEEVNVEPEEAQQVITLDELATQLKQARQEAFDEGYQKGLEEGMSAHDPLLHEENNKKAVQLDNKAIELENKAKKLEQELSHIGGLITSLSAISDDYIAENKTVLLEVVFEAVCKIIYNVVKDEDYIKDCILSFISSEKLQQNHKIELAQTDYIYLKDETDLLEKLPANFSVMPSDKVISGFIASSSNGCLDVRTEKSLENFRQLLLQNQKAEVH